MYLLFIYLCTGKRNRGNLYIFFMYLRRENYTYIHVLIDTNTHIQVCAHRYKPTYTKSQGWPDLNHDLNQAIKVTKSDFFYFFDFFDF